MNGEVKRGRALNRNSNEKSRASGHVSVTGVYTALLSSDSAHCVCRDAPPCSAPAVIP